jgi:hypothetical protein
MARDLGSNVSPVATATELLIRSQGKKGGSHGAAIVS